MRWWRILVMVCCAITPVLAAGGAGAEVKGEENVVYSFYGISESGSEAKRLMRQMTEGRRKVRKWWGPAFEGTIRVEVNDEFRIPRSLVFAWRGDRGRFELPVSRLVSNAPNVVHNLIHIYAPNANRFLAEGLAVYANQALGEAPGFPDYGKNLHALAKQHAATFDLARMEGDYPTPRSLPGPRAGAYIVAGSFTGYLIETYGLVRYKALYNETPMVPGKRRAGSLSRWERIYQKPRDRLIGEWKSFVSKK